MGFQTTPNVSTVSKSGSTALSGAVTLSEGTGVTLTQVGQDIQINAPAAGAAASEPFVTIGNTAGLSAERAITGTANQVIITDNGVNSTVVLSTPQNLHTAATPTFASMTLSGLTAGRVVFAGTAGLLSDDADFTFNTTGNVLSITSGQFNIDNLRLDGNTISSTDTNGNVVVDPAGTGSFDLVTDKQRWLGTSMVIQDVLARDIITASAVLMTIDFVNLLITQDIQVDGDIEVMGSVDLNKVTGDQIRILPDNATLAGAISAFVISSTLTFDTNTDSFQFVKANGEFKYTTGPLFGIPPIFFQFIPTIRAMTSSMSMGIAVYYNQASIIADGVTLTFIGNTYPAFWDTPSFSIANAGAFDASASYRGFQSTFTINSGTFNQRTGYIVQNATGAGTLNIQRGIFMAALTKGATANNPLFINAPDTADASGSMIDGNITIFATAGSYGGGSRVMFMANRTTAPSSNPTGGGVMYAESGALKWRGSSGSVTTIAAA